MRITLIALGLCLAAGPIILAQDGASSATGALKPDLAARSVVRRIIENEMRAEEADHTHWMYLDKIEEPGKDDVKEVVETDAVKLSMLQSRNGHLLTPTERQHEIARLQKLASDQSQIEAARRAEHEDGEKARRMLAMLPQAFFYSVQSQQDDQVTLNFWPDPSYVPPTREAMVFHAMSGTMILDTKAERLVEMRGQLANEVRFGWGILGHLDRGGRFVVKQNQVVPGYWELSELDVQMSGKALFFKSISMHQKETRNEYRLVPGNIGPQQAISMLENQRTIAQATK